MRYWKPLLALFLAALAYGILSALGGSMLLTVDDGYEQIKTHAGNEFNNQSPVEADESIATDRSDQEDVQSGKNTARDSTRGQPSDFYRASAKYIWETLSEEFRQRSIFDNELLARLVEVCQQSLAAAEGIVVEPPPSPLVSNWCDDLGTAVTLDELQEFGKRIASDPARAANDYFAGGYIDAGADPTQLELEIGAAADRLQRGDPLAASAAATALWRIGSSKLVPAELDFGKLSNSQRSRIGAALGAWTECYAAGNCGARSFAVARFCAVVPGTDCNMGQGMDAVIGSYLSPFETRYLEAAQRAIVDMRR